MDMISNLAKIDGIQNFIFLSDSGTILDTDIASPDILKDIIFSWGSNARKIGKKKLKLIKFWADAKLFFIFPVKSNYLCIICEEDIDQDEICDSVLTLINSK